MEPGCDSSLPPTFKGYIRLSDFKVQVERLRRQAAVLRDWMSWKAEETVYRLQGSAQSKVGTDRRPLRLSFCKGGTVKGPSFLGGVLANENQSPSIRTQDEMQSGVR